MLFTLACWLGVATVMAQRPMENLGRGVVAIHRDDGKVFVSWRLLGTDAEEIAFNLYRTRGDEAPVKLNSQPIRNATCFTDDRPNLDRAAAYVVRPLLNGREQEPGTPYKLASNAAVRPFLSVP